METIGDARAFLSAAREVALTKPIIVIKPGRTAQAAKAAASHTGSLTGSDEVLDAAFRRVGVLRVERISDLFGMAEVLAKQPRPRGPSLTIVTNAGGPAVLATDALVGGGGRLTELSEAAMAAYDEVLPPTWSHNNPVDIIGDAPPERYAKALEIAANDPAADGMLVILTPQAMTDPTSTANALVPFAHIAGKPVLASWMGGQDVEEGSLDAQPGGDPDLRLPGHRGRDVQLPVALGRGPARAVRDAGGAGRGRAMPWTERGRPGSSMPPGPRGGPCSPRSSRRRSWRPTASPSPRPGSRAPRTRRSPPRSRSAIRSWSSSTATRSPTRPTSAASSSTCRRRRRPRGMAIDRASRRRDAWRGALRGRDRPADDQLHGLRADRRLLHRPPVRPGAAVRDGRPARGAVPRPGPGPAAAQHDPRPPDDRAHEDRRRLRRDPRTPTDRPGRPRAAARPVQPARRGAALDRGGRHQPAARLAGAADRARRPDRPPRPRGRTGGPAAAGHPAVPAQVRGAVDRRGRHGVAHPADPARGRAADGPVPRRADRGDRLLALLRAPGPLRADGP